MTYDYIVVGGGTSGCVTAAKLATEFKAKVLLLESGKTNNHPFLKMPAGFIKMLSGSKYLNFYQTTPQLQLHGRVHDFIQAKVLGGGSSVNAMVYMRGRPSDYEIWNNAIDNDNNFGWSWREMLSHYVAQECNQSFSGNTHGVAGAVKVSNGRNICEMSDIFVKSLQTMGHEFRADFNSGLQTGVGYMQTTTDQGKRCGAVEAFIEPILDEPNLVIKTEVTVHKILFEGKVAIGVEYEKNGKTYKVYALSEIILTAGAFGTPKLLLLSGIGAAEHLKCHNISIKLDLAGVGENLMDHFEVPVVASTYGHLGYYAEDKGWNMLRNGLQYLLFGTGPVASNGCEACAFINPLSPNLEPSLQFYCVPTVYLDRDVTGIKPTDGVTLNSCLLQPKARGTVRLRSANPNDTPLINSNYLGHANDIKQLIAGLKYAREVLKSSPMQQHIKAELFPGKEVTSDEDLLAHCQRSVKTCYHYSGTCKMGKDEDPKSVVTKDLRVKGIENLRIFDISMMPAIISGNTNAAAMAIADRGVDIMTGRI